MNKPINYFTVMLIVLCFTVTGCKHGETDHDSARFDDESFRKKEKTNSGDKDGATNSVRKDRNTYPDNAPADSSKKREKDF
jgi:hypothetical protein